MSKGVVKSFTRDTLPVFIESPHTSAVLVKIICGNGNVQSVSSNNSNAMIIETCEKNAHTRQEARMRERPTHTPTSTACVWVCVGLTSCLLARRMFL